jgi:transcription elongation factor GreA|uniref:Transcription elongation factor GreA n=1 Tax=Mesoaciditoga lauensis TaxID=1495039 RepID=A0A7V3RE34_9BACT
MNKIPLTKEGYQSLKDELAELKEKLMNEVAKKIKEAREFGDLSENSEYDEAKNEQGKINSRISEIEEILANAFVIEESRNSREVNLGNTIKLKDLITDGEMTIMLVTAQEADIFKNKISADSPLGEAINKKKIGDTVRVKAPNGAKKYLILDVEQR